MAITFDSAGSGAAGSVSLALPPPASIVANNLLVIGMANKYPTNGPATPAGFTAPTNNQAQRGTGTAGVDAGNVYSTVFYRIADGTESGNVTVNIASGNSAIGNIFKYSVPATSSWSFKATTGSFQTAGTAWSIVSAADPDLRKGDILLVVCAVNGDGATFSAEACSVPGCSLGTMVERADNGTPTGDDCAFFVAEFPVLAGFSAGVATFTATASASAGDAPAGCAVFFRIREQAVTPDIYGGSAPERDVHVTPVPQIRLPDYRFKGAKKTAGKADGLKDY